MRLVIHLALLGCLPSCAAIEDRKHNQVMDQIEGSIRLPKGALPINSYARYYTEYKGKIHGAFTTEIEVRSPGVGCAELPADGGEIKSIECPKIADLAPGKRRWVDFDDYPAVAGENCQAVQLMYDPGTKKIESLECPEPIGNYE